MTPKSLLTLKRLVKCRCANVYFNKKGRGPAHHRNSLSIVGHRQQPVSTVTIEHHSPFAVFPHGLFWQRSLLQPLSIRSLFCSARPHIPFPHTAALSSARLPAHGCPSQLSPFRSLLAHDFRCIRPILPASASFTVFRTRRSQPFAHSLSHTIAFGNNRISQSSGTWLLVAAFVAHGRFCRRSPPPQSFAHGHLRQHLPFRSFLAHGCL